MNHTIFKKEILHFVQNDSNYNKIKGHPERSEGSLSLFILWATARQDLTPYLSRNRAGIEPEGHVIEHLLIVDSSGLKLRRWLLKDAPYLILEFLKGSK
jgi:hypothetical protein